MALRKAALLSRPFDGNIAVVKFLDIVERVFQPAVGKLRLAVVIGGRSTALVHVVEQKKEAGFNQQFVGGITLFPVCQHELDAGRYSLVKRGAGGTKALHRLLAIQKRKDIFVIAEVIFRALEKRGMKHDVKVFSALQISLLYGVYSVGENHDQIVCAECVRLSP